MKDTVSDKIDTINKVFRALQSWQIERNNQNIFSTQPQSDLGQKPEPDFLCACNGKAYDGICRAKSCHFRHAGSVGLEAKDGGCTAAYRPPKPKAARRPRR